MREWEIDNARWGNDKKTVILTFPEPLEDVDAEKWKTLRIEDDRVTVVNTVKDALE